MRVLAAIITMLAYGCVSQDAAHAPQAQSTDTVETCRDVSGACRWKRVAANNEKLYSSQPFASPSSCRKAAKKDAAKDGAAFIDGYGAGKACVSRS